MPDVSIYVFYIAQKSLFFKTG